MSGEGLQFYKVTHGPNGAGVDLVDHRGRKRFGIVQPLTRCTSCGGQRTDLGGPHASRWENGALIDCVGRPVGGSR